MSSSLSTSEVVLLIVLLFHLSLVFSSVIRTLLLSTHIKRALPPHTKHNATHLIPFLCGIFRFVTHSVNQSLVISAIVYLYNGGDGPHGDSITYLFVSLLIAFSIHRLSVGLYTLMLLTSHPFRKMSSVFTFLLFSAFDIQFHRSLLLQLMCGTALHQSNCIQLKSDILAKFQFCISIIALIVLSPSSSFLFLLSLWCPRL